MEKIVVCHGANCKKNNSEILFKKLEESFKDFNEIELEKSFCMGMCDKGPNVKINGNVINFSTLENVLGKIKDKFNLRV